MAILPACGVLYSLYETGYTVLNKGARRGDRPAGFERVRSGPRPRAKRGEVRVNNSIGSKSNRHSRLKQVASAFALGVASLSVSTVVATPAHAQEVNASLKGRITVEGGATQVTAIEIDTGLRRTSSIAADGSYNFPSLRPGTYRLEVTTPSGVRSTDNITLAVAQNAILNFDLAAASPPVEGTAAPADSGVVVVGQRIRSMEGGEIGATISQRQIETLPQTNRNFLAFADLAPGVTFFTGNNQESRLQGGAQSSRSVNIFIDGVGQKDYVLKNGITGQDSTRGNPFPQLAVGEYRVITSNYKAEFDQVSSVAITAVTKSGTNEFHGEGFFDFSNQSLRHATPTEEAGTGKTDSRDIQFGGALGGPIIKDVMHFFVTYEGKRFEQPRDIFPGSSDNTQNIPAGLQAEFGTTTETFDENLFFGKVDFSPTDKDLFEASIKYRKETGERINSGSDLPSNRVENLVDEKRGVLRWERSEDRWINDLKLTYEDASWAPTPVNFGNAFEFQDDDGRKILRSGPAANFQDKGQKGWGIQNDFTWTGFENHTIKAGVKAKWVKLKTLTLNNTNPVYFFNTMYNPATMSNTATWNDQVPYRVLFGFDSGQGGDPEVTSKNFQLGLYIQDDWAVNDRLNVYLGLRWDYDRTPAWVNFVHDQDDVDLVTGVTTNAMGQPLYPNLLNADYDIHDYISTGSERETFKGAFQPRIGFDYEIDDEARWILFGGYGRSYDRNQFDFLQQETSVGAFANREFRFRVPGDTRNNCTPPAPPTPSTCVAWDPIYLTPEGRAQLVAAVGPLGGTEFRFIKNNLKVPYSDQFSLGLRHRVNNLMEAEVGYSHVESKDGFVWLLGNRRPDGSFFLPAPAPQNSPFGGVNAPPGRGSIIIGDNGIETSADSVYFKFTKSYSPASPWNLNATYTFTAAEENRAFGEASGGAFSLDFPSIEDYPVLRSTGVPKHRLVMAGSTDLPYDFTVSGKLTLSSAFYVQGFTTDPVTGERLIKSIEGDAPLGDMWAQRQLDLAVSKHFAMPFINQDTRVWVRADVLNVFNTHNFTQYNSNPNSPDFGEINSLTMGGNPPRTFKLSTGFSF